MATTSCDAGCPGMCSRCRAIRARHLVDGVLDDDDLDGGAAVANRLGGDRMVCGCAYRLYDCLDSSDFVINLLWFHSRFDDEWYVIRNKPSYLGEGPD
jgi:hypothetical protein